MTDTGEARWQEYAVCRLARIYSVVVPALGLTALLYWLQRMGVPGAAPGVAEFSHPVVRMLVSALFLDQTWNMTVQALHNGPYWSIAYEVWYYALFAIWMFAPRRYRWPCSYSLPLSSSHAACC